MVDSEINLELVLRGVGDIINKDNNQYVDPETYRLYSIDIIKGENYDR